ncbi:MAG: chitobiase/beta-hexosaminidase C-terminal domain-containing protein [Victivallales bacterium]|nr:chitobiase/beta-hexosaminidase C-terminal domain-containing protein [Victivallales bacterium]
MKKSLLIFAVVMSSGMGLFAAVDLRATLDSPAGVTFVSGTGLTVRSNGYKIKNVDGGVECTNSSFLEMNGSTDKAKKPRSGRIVSNFDIQVKGSGVLLFDVCAAVWGENDDILVIYEDDIDDPLLELGGDYWDVAEKDDDGEYFYSMYGESFFNNFSIDVGTDHYNHTIHFAVLKALDSEDYEKPVLTDKDMGINIFLPSKVWLDNFVWEPDDVSELMEFFPETGTRFGADGLHVFLETSYDEGVLSFYYTTNGSTPSNKSTLYDPEDDEGIELTDTCTLKVAIYEGGTLVANNFSATYTRLPPPPAPTAKVSAATPFSDSIEVSFSCSESGVRFAYTLDGTMPDEENHVAITSGPLTVTRPCTVKVVSWRDEEVSSACATVVIEKTPAPRVTWLADGVATKSPVVFDNGATMTAAPVSGTCYYRVDGGAAVKGASASLPKTVKLVEVQALETGKLPSEVISAVFEQTAVDEWVSAADFVEGWQLWGVTRKISDQQGRALAEWLRPYGVDPLRRSPELVDKVEPGRAYWVRGPIQGKPSVVLRSAGAATPPAGSSWHLVSNAAQWVWDVEASEFVPASDNVQPGFAK